MGREQKKRSLPLGLIIAASAVGLVLIAYIFFRPHELLAEETTAQKTRLLMDTVVDVRVDAPNAAQLVDEAFKVMEELEQTLSRFVETSEVAQINQQAGTWVQVSPTTIELIATGMRMGELSQGAFDVTIGAVLDLWGFGSDTRQVPVAAELEAALATVDYRQVELDVQNSRVRIPADTILDLGGIAKGYVVQKAAELLRGANVSRAIINAGGDISVIGQRPDGQPWRVGVQDPAEPASLRWILALDDLSVVTSGDYQRYFEQDGERWHHIIDPKSGYPARGLQSVTVVGPDIVVCDAAATAIFVRGWEAGQRLVLELEGIEAILVSGGEEWISPGLQDKIISR